MSEFQTTEFLTPEECAEVDQALLSSRDKFSTRVAIYSLRSLKQIAQETGQSVESVAPDEIAAWVEHDRSTNASSLQTDAGFIQFFTQLVLSSLKPLHHIAEEEQVAIAQLTPAQIIAWFERRAKVRLEQET
jgi:hypothetical protein